MLQDYFINIIASISFIALAWITSNQVLPRIRAWLYGAPDISGAWNFYDLIPDENKPVGNGKIEQKGEIIKATVTRHTSRQGKSIARTFIYKGKVRSGQLTVSFEEPVSSGFMVGTLVLKVSSDLKELSGYTVYLDRDTNMVVTHPIIFRKT